MIFILPQNKNTIKAKNNAEAIEPILLKRPDAAKMLNVSKKTVFNLTKSGMIPCVRIGRAVRYPVQALHDYIENQTK